MDLIVTVSTGVREWEKPLQGLRPNWRESANSHVQNVQPCKKGTKAYSLDLGPTCVQADLLSAED